MATTTNGLSVDQQIAELERRLALVAASNEHNQDALQRLAQSVDAGVATHVSSVLPALADLASAAHYFWAGMLEDHDDGGDGVSDDTLKPGEDDVDNALRTLEKTLSAWQASADAVWSEGIDGGFKLHPGREDALLHTPPSEDGDDGAGVKQNPRRLGPEAVSREAALAHEAAKLLWTEINGTRLPAARGALKTNMDAIGSQEKWLSELTKSAEAMFKKHQKGKEGFVVPVRSKGQTDFPMFEYSSLDSHVTAQRQKQYRLFLDVPAPMWTAREQLQQEFAEHEAQAQKVTRLVCQGTTAKVLRDELRVHVLAAELITDRQTAVDTAIKNVELSTSPLLDAVRDLRGKLEWTDIKDEDNFPAEELLALAAKLLVHLASYSDASRRDELTAVVGSLRGRKDAASLRPLPGSVTELLRVFGGEPAQPAVETVAATPVPAPTPAKYEPPTVEDHQDDDAPAPALPLRLVDQAQRANQAQKPIVASSSVPPPPACDDNDFDDAPPPSLPPRRAATAGGSILSPVDPMPFVEEYLPPPPPQLQILGASWGGSDVTAKLQARVKDNRLTLDMRNMHTTLGDPLPYKFKHLTALYRYGPQGQLRLFVLCEQLPIFSSGVFVVAPEDPTQQHPASRVSIAVGGEAAWRSRDGGFEIVAATYGPRVLRDAEVLRRLEEYFSGRQGRIVPDNGFFRGDPWPGQPKTWTAFLRFAGSDEVLCVTGLEGQEMAGFKRPSLL